MTRCYKVKSFGSQTIENKYTNFVQLDTGKKIPVSDKKIYNNVYFDSLLAVKKINGEYKILQIFRKNFNTNEYERFYDK